MTRTIQTLAFIYAILIAIFLVSVGDAAAVAVVVQANENDNETAAIEPNFLSSIRQLTFEGRRAGEGYFSADGKQMIFQSERRSDNPFFQIYLLDLELGDVTPVSPGHGKTTCAWIHPDGKQMLFASTHDDPQAKDKQREELEFRESGQERRYSWDYDDTYELYSYNIETKKYKQLSRAIGYDAEGSYSPDGKLVAFASNRNAYLGKMNDEQKKRFEKDPASMMDIFIMNSDGTNVKQLTDVDGYDGGPFFSPDGRKICWRRFDTNGVTAEIMTMNIDGSDQRQLTRMRSMSWAPYFHPSGRYLIFNTNKHGFANFELYLVDAEGKSPPVRVTDTPGFDGLASFSPDGKQLTWTTNRNKSKQSQIYLANWNHEYALTALGLNGVENREAATTALEVASKTSAGFEDRDIMRHVDYLCRKELGGRMTGTAGEKMATAYVAAYLDNLGVKPDGENGTWYQNFEFPAGARLGPENGLFCSLPEQNPAQHAIKNYRAEADWIPLTFSRNGKVEHSKVVFVGYGIEAPEADGQPAYSSYGDTDVNGKWVLMYRYCPDEISDKQRQHLHYHSSLRKKAMVARDKGACGMIVVSGPRSNVKNQLVPLESDFSNSGSSLAAISVSDEVARHWLGQTEEEQIAAQLVLDSGKQISAFEIDGLTIAAEINVRQVSGKGRNVIGRLQMSDTPSKGAILIGAHIDHLGTGTGGSLARSSEKGQVHVGADDNASGVAAMLEVAEFLANLKRNGKLNLKRDVLFAAWSGEELGLHGSKHFTKSRIRSNSEDKVVVFQPYSGDPHDLNALFLYYNDLLDAFDVESYSSQQLELLKSNANDMRVVSKLLAAPTVSDSKNQKEQLERIWKRAKLLITQAENAQPAVDARPVAACLNMDMVGRFKDKLVLQGLGSSNDWAGLIERANAPVGLPIETSNDTQLPTDASSFYQAGVPILSAFTGSHTDYHTPRDTPEKLNYTDAARIARLMGLITRQLAIGDSVPGYLKQSEQPKRKMASAGRRARLGTVPNYTEQVAGVLLDDVAPNGPAAAAGVKGGDIIVGLAGKKVENIYDYKYAIDSLKVGKETEIVVRRGYEKLKLKITPESLD